MLYNHYDKIRKRNQYSSSLNKTNARIIEIERDLKNCNFNLNTDMQSTDYSKEQIQASVDNSSSMEKDMLREETKLERVRRRSKV